MIKGKDQTSARDFNMETIMRLLFKEEMSCSELAERIGLSKPAMTKITTEMSELKLIMPASKGNYDDKLALGRKRVYLSINPDFGVVAAIDFSTVTVKIWVCDMMGKVIEERLIPDSEFLTPDILNEICAQLHEMLNSSGVTGKELLSLCIAAAGMVDKVSGDVVVSPKFASCVGIDLHNFFADYFNCKVEVKNDVNLALLGEQQFGNKQNFIDAIMLYVDSGIGGAIMVDNKIVDGSRGFAGEFGLIDVKTDKGYTPLDLVCSINAMKQTIREIGSPNSMPKKFHFADVVKAYFACEPVVVRVVEESAEILSNIIRNLAVSLDIHNIIISGRVRMFGQSFMKKICADAPNCMIEYSLLDDDGVINGAIHEALNMAINVVIDRR